MKVYLDTNMVVARVVASHSHNQNAVALFRQIKSRGWTPVMAAHGLSEMYSVLTRTPFQPRVSPAETWQILQENVLASFEIEALTRNDYSKIIKECAAQGWSGGRIYDAIHVHVARKAQCSRIYTFNVSHFRQIAPDLHDKILAP